MEAILLILIPLAFLAFCVCMRGGISFKGLANLNLNVHWSIPIGGMFVLLLGSVFGRDFFAIEAGPIPITFDRLLLGGLIGLVGIQFLNSQWDLPRLNGLDFAILLWITVISISTITHDWTYSQKMPLSRLLFFNLFPLALYFLVRSTRMTANSLMWISVLFTGFGMYLAITAIFEVKGLHGLVFPAYIMQSEVTEFLGRGRGPFINPVSNGIFMSVCFCAVLMWWPRRTQNWQRAIVVAIAMLIAVGVYATLTRSCWMGLVLTCGAFIFWPASWKQKGLMVMAGTVIGVAAFPIVGEKVFAFKRDKNISVDDMAISAQMRPMFAIVAWNMFQDRPLTGVGFGQYTNEKDPYLRDPNTGKPLTITRSLTQHNVFLAYLTETGLIGVLVLLTMLLMMAIVCWDIWSDQSLTLWARQFGLLGIVCLINYSVNGMFHDVSIINQMHILMFFLIGLANNIYVFKPRFASADIEFAPPVIQDRPIYSPSTHFPAT